MPFPKNNSSACPESTEKASAPLSASEFRAYNRLSEHMDQFVSSKPCYYEVAQVLTKEIQHSHFRLTWNQLWDACTATGKRPGGISARQMILMGLQFCSQLDFHHSIEEQHIFPILAKKMPEFRKELDLLRQHKQIHAGLEKLEAYLEKCRSGEEDLRREEVKRLMEGFGKVLWAHLDEEVQTLGADNMRKYWSLEEMRRLPM
ncbi:hypothetical protein N7510_010443 [Penicillium lagena]|uniref:uncharacterized protein n=1 Tax=Penicillium lagena TaxID=94218 RepID=UPI0025414CD4|nr:uncharacterized protein N7510_010443 [Penicillium lagena]KAJ5605289.1 hypothetical protein N7510_010443 [Penicillium lagena]